LNPRIQVLQTCALTASPPVLERQGLGTKGLGLESNYSK
jgi:hypothetical protein